MDAGQGPVVSAGGSVPCQIEGNFAGIAPGTGLTGGRGGHRMPPYRPIRRSGRLDRGSRFYARRYRAACESAPHDCVLVAGQNRLPVTLYYPE